MLHMPSPMLLGGAEEDLYPLFLARINALATDGTVSWASSPSALNTVKVRVTPSAGIGTMTGSTWASIAPNLTYARGIQHALPSAAVFNGLASSGHQIYFEMFGGLFMFDGNGPYGKNRNGYSSANFSGEYDSAYLAFRIVDLIRFDAATGKAWRSNPFSGSAETEYDFRT